MTRRLLLLSCLGATHCVEPNPNVTATASESATNPDSETTNGTGTTDANGTTSSPGATTTSTDPTTDPTTDPDTTTGTPAGCPAPTHTCVPSAPNGWSGPGAIAEDPNTGDAPPCPTDFDTAPAVVGYSELTAAAAECACDCEPLDPSCGSATITTDASAACLTPANHAVAVNGNCTNFSAAANSYYSFAPPPVTDGSCLAKPSSMTPPASFGTRDSLCVASPLDIADACATDDVCVPVADAPFAPSACIWTEGDVECPAGSDYATRTLLHQDVDDTRGCTACSCGEIGGTCSGTLELRAQASCAGAVVGQIDVGADCELVAGAVVSAQLVEFEANGTCGAASGAQPAGSAIATEPITVCCLAG